MVQLNLALREINCKIVYFGPGLSGKTTNLEVVHEKAPEQSKGELTSIATESDRTLFFDFMPLNLGTVGGMKTKFQLYTVPGQVYYNSTRKLVLRGADGVIFVADSSEAKMAENIESLDNLEECLKEQGRSLAEMPHVLQWNKRDLPDAMDPEELDKVLNRYGAPAVEAMANKGDGVIETFKALSSLVLEKVKTMAEERNAGVRQRRGRRSGGPAGGSPASSRPASGGPAKKSAASSKPKAPAAPAAPAAKDTSETSSKPAARKITGNTPPMPEPKKSAASGGAAAKSSRSTPAPESAFVDSEPKSATAVSNERKQEEPEVASQPTTTPSVRQPRTSAQQRIAGSQYTSSRQRIVVSSGTGPRGRKKSSVNIWLVVAGLIGAGLAYAIWNGMLLK